MHALFLRSINLHNKLFKLFKLKKLSKKETIFIKKVRLITSINPKNIQLYYEAFTHASSKNGSLKNYERLEFLGDSVLGVIISDYIYNKFPDKNEGFLSQLRSKIVNRNLLNEIGNKLGLLELLIKEKNQSVNKQISGNLLESLIGAIYLDRGIEETRNFILNKIISSDSFVEDLDKKILSYRGYLLEWAHKNKRHFQFNIYEEENAIKQKVFVCEILENNKIISKGREISKKQAIEKASRRAFYALKKVIF
ncbi:MAG: ribonuclease III family protein [Solirubrobacteraceae bacterium]